MSEPASPFACEFCAGGGYETTEYDGVAPCLLCGGSGYRTLVADAGATHSQPRRPFAYSPGCRRLAIGLGAKAASYTVGEFQPSPGFEGRAFLLHKTDGSGRYACLVGTATASCDCAGATYQGTEKANVRSWLRDDREFQSLGCKHLDALRVLLEGGWLDLPEHVPTDGDE